ncbi:MAG: type IX secretion system outer membrane channel protein PorV [Duncaniella sp.]|nr:type IX secretion system outer membrane channel protein PorV [Duncaniella sp.]MDE6328760.1 type IX secretion system outer membrane channel protein PorV [Duncaniella sp.]
MNLSAKILLPVAISGVCAAPAALADGKNDFNPIQTGVTSLGIAPDARGASMGDLGAATDPDVNSQFWNPSKYAFAYSSGGVGISYTPWLRKLVNDIFLANLSGYWKLGQDDNQAVSASLRYFSLGEVSMDNQSSGEGGTSLNPYEMSFDVGYSRKLSEKFSMGVVFRYIYSDLGFSESYAGDQSTGASAFSADISGYYTTYPIIGRNECQWSWGFDISNIGSKVNFNHGDNPAFLPTNLRLGTSFTFPLADYHNLSLNLDLNKLLVPTMPRRDDFEDGTDGEIAYVKAYEDWQNMSSIKGIFKSFGDAPGGMSEEFKEISFSLGAEYNYNQQFFLRAGYYYQHPSKGNLQYFGLGAGFALNVLRLDASYMLATAQTSPLDQTLRFTLTFDMDGLKEIFGKK